MVSNPFSCRTPSGAASASRRAGRTEPEFELLAKAREVASVQHGMRGMRGGTGVQHQETGQFVTMAHKAFKPLLVLGLAITILGLLGISSSGPVGGAAVAVVRHTSVRGNLRINLSGFGLADGSTTDEQQQQQQLSFAAQQDGISAQQGQQQQQQPGGGGEALQGLAAAVAADADADEDAPPQRGAEAALEPEQQRQRDLASEAVARAVRSYGDLPPELRVPLRSARVHIVTTVHKSPCQRTLVGNWIELLAVKNKEDFAAARGYEAHWFAADANATMHGNWNKLGAILNVLGRLPANDDEWLLWADSDTLLLGLNQEIPFAEYEGRHVVMWGGNDEAMKKEADPLAFNAGVMLIRNSERSRQFFGDLAQYTRPEWRLGGEFEPRLRAEVKNWRPGLPNQVAMAHLLRTKPEYADDVLCAHPHMHRLWHFNWEDSELGAGAPDPFVLHWPGCQFCKPHNSDFDNRDCIRSFLTAYARADAQLSALLGNGAPFDVSMIGAVLDKVY